MFAFGADLGGHPPHGRVVEQQRLDESLEQVHQVIVSADVGQFVCEDGLDLRRRQACQDGGGYQHRRAKHAEHHRSGQAACCVGKL